jgi:AraC-like DNA-binding protein
MSANHLGHLSLDNWRELAANVKFDLDVLCSRLNISRRTLERYFNQKFSLSPAKWCHRQKMEKSVQFLKKGFVAKEICAELGFTSETNFSHQFHRYFGCPPQEYIRRQNAVLAMADSGVSKQRSSSKEHEKS